MKPYLSFRDYISNRVIDNKNKTKLIGFKIDGLYDKCTIELDLDKGANIFIGENGLGKTTILKCLYYALSKRYSRLSEINFKKITFFFSNNDKCSISRKEILEHLYSRRQYTLYDYRKKTIDDIIFDFFISYGVDDEELLNLSSIKIRKISSVLGTLYKFPPDEIREYIMELKRNILISKLNTNTIKTSNLFLFSEKIRKNITNSVIYLPTYRRIESSINNLDYDEIDCFYSSIQFGMNDVQKSIDEVLQKIRNQTMLNYYKMTGVLLKEYSVKDYEVGNQKIDKNSTKIVLNRLGNEIDNECRDIILSRVEDGSINNSEFDYLRNYLQHLIRDYNQLKIYDEKIINFIKVCNTYFEDNEFYYEPSSLDLYIYSKLYNKKIELEDLSSGEKQIVSIFANLYLEVLDNILNKRIKNTKKIILIDEPELSLSIKWQKKILPDIMDSGNCDLLVAMTHSPFIFENRFDSDVKEINRTIL